MPSDRLLEIAVRIERTDGADRFLEVDLGVPGGVTVLSGPSGSGKTTTLAVAAGLVRPSSGSVRLGERTLFDGAAGIWVPPHERRIALVFQSLALFPHLTVEQNVAYGIPASVERAERRRRACLWLERMHALHVRHRAVPTLSGGEAQRVALARALASEPQALLLDEPFSALDCALRRELVRELCSVVEELGLPTLVVSHDADDVTDLGAKSVTIEAGVLAAPIRRWPASKAPPPQAPYTPEILAHPALAPTLARPGR
jgi:molybdate transport system ATP-binding protein